MQRTKYRWLFFFQVFLWRLMDPDTRLEAALFKVQQGKKEPQVQTHHWHADVSSTFFFFLNSIERHRLSKRYFFFFSKGVNRKQGESQRWDPFSSSEWSDIWNKEASYVSTCVWDRQTDKRPNTPSQINRPRRVGSHQDDSLVRTQEDGSMHAHTQQTVTHLCAKLP